MRPRSSVESKTLRSHRERGLKHRFRVSIVSDEAQGWRADHRTVRFEVPADAQRTSPRAAHPRSGRLWLRGRNAESAHRRSKSQEPFAAIASAAAAAGEAVVAGILPPALVIQSPATPTGCEPPMNHLEARPRHRCSRLRFEESRRRPFIVTFAGRSSKNALDASRIPAVMWTTDLVSYRSVIAADGAVV